MILDRDSNNQELIEQVETLSSKWFDGYQLVDYILETQAVEFRNSVKVRNMTSYKHGLRVTANIGNKACSLDIIGNGLKFWKNELEKMKEQVVKASPMKEFHGYPEEREKSPGVAVSNNLFKSIEMEERLSIVDNVIDIVEVEEKTAKASGILESTAIQIHVKNSNNIDNMAKSAHHHLQLTVNVKKGAGCNTVDRYFKDLEYINLGETAINSTMNAIASSIASKGEAGFFPVILEPAAVEKIMFKLSILASGAAINSNLSCLKDFKDQLIFNHKLTVNDDPGSAMTVVNLGIDGEGTRKEFYPIIQEGTFTGVIHDHLSAAETGCKTTGHKPVGFDHPFLSNLQVLNMVFQDGGSDYEEMVSSIAKGFQISDLRISSFNPVTGDMICTVVNGALIIKSGEVITAAKDLVFAGNIIKMLKDVPLIGAVNEARVYGCPHLKTTTIFDNIVHHR
ncbi:MAG: metallopeptidase TldD-related protein [Candidatus Hodarchaeales archaeon]